MAVETGRTIAITTLRDWLKILAPVFSTNEKQNDRTMLARFFPRFERVIGVHWEFWLVHRAVCSCCDWSE